MSPVTSQSSNCYNLVMPNPDSNDEKLKLNVRTGAGWILFQSRVLVYGGSTIPLQFPSGASLKDIDAQLRMKLSKMKVDWGTSDLANKYFSNEVFSLSLINQQWVHLPPRNSTRKRPQHRMYPSLTTYDNYIYIQGGLTFNSKTQKLEPLDDLWRFDLFEKEWTCISEHLSGSSSLKRFDHKLLYCPSLSIINRESHNGLLIIGGKDGNDNHVHRMDIFDLVEQKWYEGDNELTLKKFNTDTTANTDSTEEATIRTVDYDETVSSATLITNLNTSVPSYKKSLLIYKSTPKNSTSEPLIHFSLNESDDLTGNKIEITKGKSIRNNKGVPYALNYPSMAQFGENIIVCGFMPKDLNISLFLYHTPSQKWSRLQVFCSHNTWTHRFCKAFLWSSHHKIILLGNDETSSTPPSMQFFNLYIAVSLPFTNAIGGDHSSATVASGKEEKKNFMSSTATPTLTLKSTSDTSASSDLKDASSTFDDDANPDSSISNEKMTSFVEYSHYVAPELNITSIKSVFLPYAMTLGKSAFERSGTFSDFEFVSADGISIPVPMIILLCRWGKCFETMLAQGYARAYADIEDPNRKSFENASRLNSESGSVSSFHKSHFNQYGNPGIKQGFNANKPGMNNMGNSSNSMGNERSPVIRSNDTPQFRLPFQDKNVNSSNNMISSVNSRFPSPNPNIPFSPSRHNSLQINSRRASAFRRNSSISINSLTMRRNSAVSVTSSNSSFMSSPPPNGRLPQLATQPLPPAALSTSTFPDLTNNPMNNSSTINTINSPTKEQISVKNLPPPPPMPADLPPCVEPEKSRPNSQFFMNDMSNNNSSISLSKSNSPVQSQNIAITPLRERASSMVNMISPSSSPRSSISNIAANEPSSIQNPQSLPGSNNNSSLNNSANLGNARRSEAKNETKNEIKLPPNLKLDAKYIPRSLCMPFDTSTVRAFTDYMFTGQVGSSWTIVPTGMEVLLLAKMYEVPLLYDLLLEILYVIVSKKEAQLVREGNQLKQEYAANNISIGALSAKEGGKVGISAIDQFTQFLTKVDDGMVDLALLRRASKVTKKPFRDDNSIHSSGHHSSVASNVDTISGHRRSITHMPSRLRNSITTMLSDSDEDSVHTRRSSRSSRGSRASFLHPTVTTPLYPASHSKTTELIADDSQPDALNQSPTSTTTVNKNTINNEDEVINASPSQSQNNKSSSKTSASSDPSTKFPNNSGEESSDKTDGVNSSSESDQMKATIAFVDKQSYSNSSQEENNSGGDENTKESGKPENKPKITENNNAHNTPNATNTNNGKENETNRKRSKWPTFQELSMPDSPPCADIVIDLLVEIGALTSDLKLMLRALNAREMSNQLKIEKANLEKILKQRSEESSVSESKRKSQAVPVSPFLSHEPPPASQTNTSSMSNLSKLNSPVMQTKEEKVIKSDIRSSPQVASVQLVAQPSTSSQGSEPEKKEKAKKRLGGIFGRK
ncbi:hypothetical protein B5S28_g2407 [[Candida] boidinii]|nr:hypothetical protein B5S28_g2407 [[Candida] boidinii]